MEISPEARVTTSTWLLLLLIAGGVLSGLAIDAPKQAPQFPNRGLVVGSFNVQQGYKTDGEPNFECVTNVLKKEMPHVVGLQESDSVHVVSGNVNVLGYMADKLGLYRTEGPAGYRASVGVSLLSQYPLQVVDKAIPSGAHEMPATKAGALNRFLTHSRIAVNGTNVDVISVHAEWFGDPAVQMGYLAKYIAKFQGPLVITGDFNLDVSGQNDATLKQNITTNGFQALLTSPELKSASVIQNPSCAMVTKGGSKYCPGALTTVDMGSNSTPGYQLDYIWYRGLILVGGLEASAVSRTCSDHLFVKATFLLPPTVAPAVNVAAAPTTAAAVTAAPTTAPSTAAASTAAPTTTAATA